MNIRYTPRDNNEKISNYIKDSIKLMNTLDYEIIEFFDEVELFNILVEDLPGNKNLDDKFSFIRDICSTSLDFFQQTKSKSIKIQIKIVADSMCRLFHADNNIQRLLCTYSGPGTEWLEEENINRDELGNGDNSKIVRDFNKVRSTTIFDLLLLKGDRFNNETKGAVHRSPPMELVDQKRVLLKIDEL
jgi:hypothetical protein